MYTRYHTSFRALPVLIVLLTVAGCVTVQGRLEKADRFETQGRHADAATYYARALKAEPGNRMAHDGLVRTGQTTLDRYLDEAYRLAESGRDEQAVSMLDRVDAMRRTASSVGVRLEVPEDYASIRRDFVDNAYVSVVTRAERAEQNGDFAGALRLYERALTRYQPPSHERAAITEARGRTLLRWAEADLYAGRPRAAFERARQAGVFVGSFGPMAEMLARIQADAVASGTEYVAFMPPVRADGVQMSRALVTSTFDHLVVSRAPLPLFVDLVDPRLLDRELRRLRFDRDPLNRRQAADVGRSVGADAVVLTQYTAFYRAEQIHREEIRRTRMRGRAGRDTSYVVQTLTVTLNAEVAYQVVDAATRRVIDEGTVRAAASDRFSRARFDGPTSAIDIPRNDQRLFDDAALARIEAGIEDALAAEVAEKVGIRVYDRVLKRIP
jgi:tetratricopeptide (TPR) repeat protein